MSQSIKAGIIGAAGYTGGELLRILLQHPHVSISFAYSRSQAGKKVYEVHGDLFGETEISFTIKADNNVDVVFLCLPHGEARAFLEQHQFSDHTRIIDLSNDFRLQKNAGDFVYGLPELNKEQIRRAKKIANPGCFASAIELALLPLASKGLLNSAIHVSGITGSTGAGVSLSETSHFTWRSSNMAVYKAFTHQHLAEIGETLGREQQGFKEDIHFIPYRGDFTRGIIITAYTTYNGTLEEAKILYNSFYRDQPFTIVAEKNIDLKQVVNTNKCLLYLEKHGDQLMIVSVIDNLVKGASGQAVQNMNLLFGFDEGCGLRLKGSAY